jgi:hypothetical protein
LEYVFVRLVVGYTKNKFLREFIQIPDVIDLFLIRNREIVGRYSVISNINFVTWDLEIADDFLFAKSTHCQNKTGPTDTASYKDLIVELVKGRVKLR